MPLNQLEIQKSPKGSSDLEQSVSPSGVTPPSIWRTAVPRWLSYPSLMILVSGLAAAASTGLSSLLDATDTVEFCISCHEMNTVYEEYKQTVHYSNRSGVRAVCPDCHVPRDLTQKLVRKGQAVNDLHAKLTGRVDTPEKFEARRLALARNEWKRMKESDSRECRNCHDTDAMSPGLQKQRARKQHELALRDRQTCIDCHKGIAHKRPVGMNEEEW